MKAMKKIVLLLLCLAMVLSMAACGGNATTETKSETTTAAPETSETATETTADPANTTYQDTITVGVANDITTLDPQGSNTDMRRWLRSTPRPTKSSPAWPRPGPPLTTAAPSRSKFPRT